MRKEILSEGLYRARSDGFVQNLNRPPEARCRGLKRVRMGKGCEHPALAQQGRAASSDNGDCPVPLQRKKAEMDSNRAKGWTLGHALFHRSLHNFVACAVIPGLSRSGMQLRRMFVRIVLASGLACSSASASDPGPVFVAPLKSEVSEAHFFFLRRALKQAEREGASAFIIDMETPGGKVDAALEEMDALLKTKVPTYTYVNPRALSAGALIAMATQRIYMAPTGVIGAAAPVDLSGEDLSKTMKQKSVSALSATARAAAQKNGHNPDVADAFIDDTREVRIGETVVHQGNSLLTLSAEEAARKYDGKPLLAAGVAASLDELLKMAALTGPVRHLEPTGFERLAFWITSLAPLFLLGGIIGGYLEYKMPGFGLPGMIAILCFALFFFGHYLAGLAGWEVIVCFSIGLALVLGELLVHPGTILPGLAGAMLMLGSLIFAMVDRWPSQPVWPSGDQLLAPMLQLSLTFLLAIAAIAWLGRFLPRTSLYRQLVLQAEVPTGTHPVIAGRDIRLQIGDEGRARTALRPSGKAAFAEEIVAVVSNGPLIDAGAAVRVVGIEGTRVLVEEIAAESGADRVL